MCIPGNDDGGSYDKADAEGDANLKFGLSALSSGLKFFGNRQKISRQNKEIENKHADDVYAYNLKNQLDAVKWRHQINQNDADADSAYIKAVDAIAKNNLDVWNRAADTSSAVAASYAKMLSVGMGEQAGRRGGGTNYLKAVQEQGRKMAELGAKLSGDVAQSRLANAMQVDTMRRTIFKGDVDTATSRPIPGTPPILRSSEYHQQDSPLTMVAGLGSAWLDRRSTLREMTPPDTKDKGYTPGSDESYEAAKDTFDIETDSSRWQYDGSLGNFGTNTFDVG